MEGSSCEEEASRNRGGREQIFHLLLEEGLQPDHGGGVCFAGGGGGAGRGGGWGVVFWGEVGVWGGY